MKCDEIERWVSDDLDGALTPKYKESLESHLSACPACREYRRQIRRIQAESIRLVGPEVSPEHLEALSAGIMGKLRLERQGKEAGRALPLIWRWARLAAPAVLALALGLLLLRGRGEELQDDMFSFEGCFNRIDREIAGDAEVAAVFSCFVTESLAEEEDSLFASEDPNIWNEPYFWEGLSDDELKLIEEEVKKEIRS